MDQTPNWPSIRLKNQPEITKAFISDNIHIICYLAFYLNEYVLSHVKF